MTGIDTARTASSTRPARSRPTPREPDAIGWLDDDAPRDGQRGRLEGRHPRLDRLRHHRARSSGTPAPSSSGWRCATGLHNEARAGKKGVEIEGLAVATLGGQRYAFVGSERSNFVAVYDVDDAAHPRFVQVLATTNGPEGILPVPSRDLLLVSSETDDASVLVRSSVSVFGRGKAYAQDGGHAAVPERRLRRRRRAATRSAGVRSAR